MAAQKVVVEGSSVTALQLKDMFRQIADGSLTGDHIQAMLEHRDPFAISVMTVDGDMIIRRAKPDRSRTPQQALDATGRKQYTNKNVVATMPKGKDDEVEVHFFNLGRYVSDDVVEKEYAKRGLVPADPYSLAAVNEADPAFANERPNCTHWKDENGRWCYAAFYPRSDERYVSVDRHDCGWNGDWFFAGVRK